MESVFRNLFTRKPSTSGSSVMQATEIHVSSSDDDDDGSEVDESSAERPAKRRMIATSSSSSSTNAVEATKSLRRWSAALTKHLTRLPPSMSDDADVMIKIKRKDLGKLVDSLAFATQQTEDAPVTRAELIDYLSGANSLQTVPAASAKRKRPARKHTAPPLPADVLYTIFDHVRQLHVARNSLQSGTRGVANEISAWRELTRFSRVCKAWASVAMRLHAQELHITSPKPVERYVAYFRRDKARAQNMRKLSLQIKSVSLPLANWDLWTEHDGPKQ